MYDIESFYEAVSVGDAISKLQEWPDAEIISGGSDVLIKSERANWQAKHWSVFII